MKILEKLNMMFVGKGHEHGDDCYHESDVAPANKTEMHGETCSVDGSCCSSGDDDCCKDGSCQH